MRTQILLSTATVIMAMGAAQAETGKTDPARASGMVLAQTLQEDEPKGGDTPAGRAVDPADEVQQSADNDAIVEDEQIIGSGDTAVDMQETRRMPAESAEDTSEAATDRKFDDTEAADEGQPKPE